MGDGGLVDMRELLQHEKMPPADLDMGHWELFRSRQSETVTAPRPSPNDVAASSHHSAIN
jgi:hypothetical protein